MNTCFFFLPGEPLLPKTPHVYVTSSASGKVFGSMQELTSVAEFTAFFEEYQRRCLDGDVDDLRLRFDNTLKIQAQLVTRRICSAANIFKQTFYRERLINVAMDLKKGTIFRDNYEIFVNICLLYREEVISCE